MKILKKKEKKNNRIKDKFKDVINSMKVITVAFFTDLKKNPKKTIFTLINNCAEIVKNISVFFTYIIS